MCPYRREGVREGGVAYRVQGRVVQQARRNGETVNVSGQEGGTFPRVGSVKLGGALVDRHRLLPHVEGVFAVEALPLADLREEGREGGREGGRDGE